MLVCSVSLRAPLRALVAEAANATATADTRRDFAVELTEAITATDESATGNVEFATLVDDPASVTDTVDAYLGEIMLEAASASDTVDLAGATYAAAVDEAVTAIDVQDGTASGAAPTRSAMIPGVFVNPGASREAHVIGTMVNL